jgi:tetratricopeptide (TPR) repeat protein
MHKSNFALILSVLILCIGNVTAINASQIQIGGHAFETPSWWEEIEVDLPATASVLTHEQMSDYIAKEYGSETGDTHTWKHALKTYVEFWKENPREAEMPVYIGHCFKAGGKYKEAASVYVALCKMANELDDEDREWFLCYLSYSAGKCYAEIDEIQEAIQWFEFSSTFSSSSDSAIRYYAEQSSKFVGELKKE